MIHPTYYMLAQAILSTQTCCWRTIPYITEAEQEAQDQGHYVTDEQYIHIPVNMIHICLRNNYTHSLYSEDGTPKISLWLQLKHSNFVILLLRKLGRNRQKKHPITPNQSNDHNLTT